MPDQHRLGEPGERNPNEAMEEDGSTQGLAPGTGDPAEGAPAGQVAPGGIPPTTTTGTGTTTGTSTGGGTGDTSGAGR